jgi:hypothetical protein
MTLRIAALGLSTAFAPGRAETVAAMADTPSCHMANPRFVGADWRQQITGFRPAEGTADLIDRLSSLLTEAIADLGLHLAGRLRGRLPIDVRLCLAAPDPDHGLPVDRLLAAAQALPPVVQKALAETGLFQTGDVGLVTEGVTGPVAILARASIGAGRGLLVLCADTYADRARLQALSDADRLFTDDMPWGLIPGEAAGAILLAAPDVLTDLRLTGDMPSVATGLEPVTEDSPDDSTFGGLSETAFAALGRAEGRCARLMSDWNNSRYRVSELSYTLVRISRSHLLPDVLPDYPALAFGDCGAAFLPLAIHLACDGGPSVTHPTLILCGDRASGTRGAVIIAPQGAF